ncbi:hypothetical protein [Mycobacterium intracellulare]|uniref:Uncharacterized protein n=1 Tax=Mycobacterium intracellulare TaxID=1767 RepID=A0AAE4REB7_MYCIT|nr:hypothetical protein [Mycobacterium intracellulare]MDV6979608.1 hypothetical protein [Mycobacterium intracellulare]MDV6985111.1 hypothetical protein [Mycobacterium intracellulare]MDV7014269.1 hypothetical protein [Mycobacterium intracellulare]MDV7030101.1 hypothetical protein [Mycobacterium intracellulare]
MNALAELLDDAAAGSRRKPPLDIAVRNGRAHWRRQLRLRAEAAQRALDAGDLEAAAELVRRAQVCQRALQRWDSVEEQGRARGELAS